MEQLVARNTYPVDASRPVNNVLVRDLAERLFRQKLIIRALFIGWTFIMAAYLIFSADSYEEEIRFLVNNIRSPALVGPDMNNGPAPRDYVDESVIATEVQLLSSADLMRLVVEKAGLAESNDATAKEKAARQLKKDLKVAPVLKANMIRATYSSSDPKEVQTVLQQLADGYLAEHLRAHGSSGSFDLFDKQANEYQDKLRKLQAQQLEFEDRNNIVLLGQQKDLNLKRVMDMEASLNEIQAARMANANKIAKIKRQLSSQGSRITTQARKIPNQYSVERLNTMLVELENRRTNLLMKFQPRDRMVLDVEQQIADTKAALAKANSMIATEETTDVNPLRQSLEAELAKAEVADAEYRARSASLSRDIESYRQSLSGLQGSTGEHDQLMRQIKETEDAFFLYSKKREEAKIQEALDRQKIANVVLVEKPRLPVLPKPKLSITTMATYVLGCLLILGAGIATSLAHRSVHTPWELEGLTGVPVLATVPNRTLATTSYPALDSAPELNS